MNTKKIGIYDSQKHFYRFLKYEFRNTFEFDFFGDFSCFENVINDYSTILFVVYSEEEIINLITIQIIGIPIIVCSYSENLLLKLKNIDEFILLNTSQIKSEVRAKIRLILDSINKS